MRLCHSARHWLDGFDSGPADRGYIAPRHSDGCFVKIATTESRHGDRAACVKRNAEAICAVTVAICAYHRQQGLQRALEGLWRQTGLRVPVTVIVVDNDPAASAQDVVDRAKPPLEWTLRYVVEQRPGVSHARNRCLAETQTEFIAFIDDDEVPEPGWLAALLETQGATRADAVFGAVVPLFEAPPPEWIHSSNVHEKPRHPTRSVIGWEHACTANVLMNRRMMQLAGGDFDARFAVSGGEDTLLFSRAERAGAKFVWCDEAVVIEYVPASRMRLAWILRRSFRGGQTWVRIRSDASPAIWLPMALRGLISAMIAGLMLLPALAISRGAAVRQAQRVAGGLGKMSAWWAERAARGARAGHYVG